MKDIDYTDHKQCNDAVAEISYEIIKMEDSYDFSMRGVFLERLVKNYNEKLINNYDKKIFMKEIDYKDFRQCREAIAKMASEIIKMEDSGDYSMRGVFLDQVVTEYVKNYGERFALMFNTIYDRQIEDYDDYGDIDVKVTKLKIVGDIINRKNYTEKMKQRDDEDNDYSAKAILLQDCCGCSGMFIISEVTRKSKQFADSFSKLYTVHQVDKDVTEIDLSKLSPNGEDCIVQWENEFLFGWRMPNHSRMMYFYNKFKDLIDTIRTPYWQLTEGQKQND